MGVETKIRLQGLLAKAGVASRRGSAELIRAGRVRVNGQVVTVPGERVGQDQSVTVDGRKIADVEEKVYYLFHKPKGVVTTLNDPQGRVCLPAFLKNVPSRVFPVGRLDADSEGLLLLTNDGEVAYALTHPSLGAIKLYQVWLDRDPSLEEVGAIGRGAVLDDGPAVPVGVRQIKRGLLEIRMREGRKREIRRLLAAFGFRVRRLLRLQMGPLSLGKVKPGSLRPLTGRERGDLLAYLDRLAKEKENREKTRISRVIDPSS